MAEFATTTGTIFYEVIEPSVSTGQRQTLTLLHNFMSTGRSAWGPLLEKLATHFRLLLPDLPGHGHSTGYPSGFHHGQMAQQVAELMAAENALHGHLAGCSAGGMIAQLLVDQQLATPKSLTLISTTYSTDPTVVDGTQNLKPENFRAGRQWMAATAKLHDPYHYTGYYEAELLAKFRQLDPATTIDLSLDRMRTWHFPVCLIHGTEDEFFPATIATQMAAALPNAELQLVADQPHALLFRQPWKVAELMLAFYQRTSL
jgi:pimeloyl-ACP methyl ester carboxylesterase